MPPTKVAKKETLKDVKDEVKPAPVVEVKQDVVENEVDNENETKKVTFDEQLELMMVCNKNLIAEARAQQAQLNQLRRLHASR